MSGTLHGSTDIFQEISEWGWVLLWSSTLFTPRRIHWFRCPLSGMLFILLYCKCYDYHFKSYALSGIVNVLETIGQMHKFSGNTIVTFSLKNNNGRTVFLSCIYWQPLWLSMSEIYEWDYQMNPEWLFFLCNILMKHKLQYLVVLIKGKGLGLKPKDWVSVIVSRLPRDLNP